MKHFYQSTTKLLVFLMAFATMQAIASENSKMLAESGLECPETEPVQCFSDIPEPNPDDLELNGDCSGGMVVWDGDVVDGDECSGTVTRTYIAFDECQNEYTCVQVFEYNDTEVPQFSEEITNITVECEDDVPPFVEIPAIDNCTADASTWYFETSILPGEESCELTTAVGPGVDWSIVLFNLPGATDYYVFEPGVGNMEVYGDGSAIITGTVTANNNPNQQWHVFMRLENKRNWTDWEALGRSYKDDLFLAEDNYLDWDYYELDNNNSFLIGAGDFEGSFLQLSHMPANYFFGFQCGIAANGRNANNGLAGWFHYEGILNGNSVSGHGDINVDKECEDNPETELVCVFEIERFFIAADDCGNVNIINQTITVDDTTPPEFTATPANLFFDCFTDIPAPDLSELDAEDNCGGPVEITYAGDIFVSGDECNGIIHRTFDAVDVCGNLAKHIQIITVADTVAPVLAGVPGDLNLSCEDEVPAPADVVASDNCTAAMEVMFNEEVEQDEECPQASVITRTWMATDECGNSTTAVQVITIVDETAPEINECPADADYSCITDVPDADISLVSATDNCGEVTITHAGDEWEGDECAGTIIRTYIATDECGNSTECVQTITYNDSIAPVFINPPAAQITVDCASVPEVEELEVEDNCSEVVIEFEETFFSGGCPGVIQRVWTATDQCGNHTVFEQFITLVDTVAPTLHNLPENAVIECDQPIPPVAEVTATDNCDAAVNVMFEETTEAGNCPQEFTIFRIWTATDTCENTTSHTQVIEVVDTTPPTFDMEDSEITLSCEEEADIVPPSAFDNCSENVLIALETDVIEGECANEWTEVYTWTATDECDNSASVSLTINYVDDTSPEFVETPDDLNFDCIANVTEPDTSLLTAEDNCGDVEITHEGDDMSGTDCDAVISRTYRATDACGNFTEYVQTITVADTVAPMLVGVPMDTEAGCDNIPEPAVVTASDNCTDEVNVIFSEVMEEGQCPQSYVIVRTWSAADDCGNEASATQFIIVSDTIAPVITECAPDANYDCIDDVPAPDTSLITAVDNCGAVSITHGGDVVDGDECEGTITRTYIATDECGNSTECVQVITYNDNVAPQFVNPPANITVDCSNVPDPMDIEVTDNCSEVDVDFSEVYFSGGCPGVLERTWVATDQCGNSTTHVQYINLIDTIAPTLHNVPDDITVNCDDEMLEDLLSPEMSSTADGNNIIMFPSDVASQNSLPIGIEGDSAPGFPSGCFQANGELRTAIYFSPQELFNRAVTVGEIASISYHTKKTTAWVPPPPIYFNWYFGILTEPNGIDDDMQNYNRGMNMETFFSANIDAPANQWIKWSTDEGPNRLRAFDPFRGANQMVFGTYDDPFWEDIISGPIDWSSYNQQYAPGLHDYREDTIKVFQVSTGDPWAIGFDGLVDGVRIELTDGSVATVNFEPEPDSNGNGDDDDDVFATDNCDAEVDVELSVEVIPGECPQAYTIIRTWTATDSCDNTVSQSQIITVEPLAPEISGEDMELVLSCDEEFEPMEFTATDPCEEGLSITLSTDSIPGDCPNNYTMVYTFSTTNSCSLSAERLVTVHFVDETAPEFTETPADLFFDCIEDVPAADTGLLAAEDNCGDVEITHEGDDMSGTDCDAVISRTYRATDACGNFTEYVQTITVADTVAPMLAGVPMDTEASCDNIPEAAVVTATDNCTDEVNVIFSEVIEEGQCPQSYVIVRTWSAADDCGNEVSATQFIIVSDTIAPVITECAPDANYDCIDDVPAPDTSLITAVDNCGAVSITHGGDVVDGDECEGTITRTYIATDECGNSSSCVQIITYSDNEPPVFVNAPENTEAACDNVPDPAEVTATDNCSEVTIEFEETLFSGGCPGVLQRIWTAVDACGNETIHEQFITLIDTVAPTIHNVPSDVTLSCDDEDILEFLPGSASGNNLVYYPGDGNFDSDPPIGVPNDSPPGFESGSFAANGSTKSAIAVTPMQLFGYNITVGDIASMSYYTKRPIDYATPPPVYVNWFLSMYTTPNLFGGGNDGTWFGRQLNLEPYFSTDINAPANQWVQWSTDEGPNRLRVFDPYRGDGMLIYGTYNNPFWSDITSGPINWGSLDPNWADEGDFFYADETILFFNIATGTAWADGFEGQVDGFRIELTNGDVATVNFEPAPDEEEGDVFATDNCDEDVDLQLTTEIIPGECPQQFTIVRTWTATDECDNFSTATQTITIEAVAPEISGEDMEMTIGCDSIPELPQFTVTDACQEDIDLVMTMTTEEGECENEWTEIYTWTAMNACGLSAERVVIVHYVDDAPPVFVSTPDDMFFACIEDVPAPNVNELDAEDNCGDVVITHDGDFQMGEDCDAMISRIYRATDACGNFSEYTQIIMVADTVAPTFDESVENMEVECDEVPEPDTITASDNCTANVDVVFNEEMEPGECEGSYTLVRTWTATDDCGNESVLTQIITVEDNTPPVFVDAPDDATYTCDEEIPEMETPVAVDNCSSTITYTAEEFIDGYTGEDGLAQCHLTTPFDVVGQPWALWLPNNIGEPQYYYLTEAGGSFVELPNGRAHLTGVAYASNNPGKRWIIDVYFKDRADWDEWSGLGRSYKDDANFATAGGLFENWDYYILNADSAILTGDGLYAGSSLDLSHAPASLFFGFQVGEAANNRNAADGMSGWFFYNGQWNDASVNGIGDFAFEKECPECDYTITRIWTATDDCGNSTSVVQIITVQPGEESDMPEIEMLQPELEVVLEAFPNPSPNRAWITFELPELSKQTQLEVIDMTGKVVQVLYRGEAAAQQEYRFEFDGSGLHSGIYLYRLTTDNEAHVKRLVIAK